MYELTQLLASLRRRRRQAIVLFLVLLVLGSVAVLLFPLGYAISSQVLIKRPDTMNTSSNYPQIDALLSSNRDTAIETYIAMALRPTIPRAVIDQLGLKISVKNFLKWHLVVTPVTHADIINIQVTWHDPNVAAAAANAFAREFVAEQRTLAASQASEAAASLSVALQKAKADLSNGERALTLFESRHEISDASTQTAAILAAISDIQAKERNLEGQRSQEEGQLSSLSAQIGTVPATIDAATVIGASPTSDQLEQQLSQQRVALRLLRAQFTERYPEVIATERQIAGLEATLAKTPGTRVTSRNVEPNPLSTSLVSQAATLQSQVIGDHAQLSLLRTQETTLQDQLRMFPRDVTQLQALQRQAKSAEQIYDVLQENYFNAVVAKSMAVSDLSVVADADPALAKVRPPRVLSLLAIAIVALLVTLATIALLEWYALWSVSRAKRTRLLHSD